MTVQFQHTSCLSKLSKSEPFPHRFNFPRQTLALTLCDMLSVSSSSCLQALSRLGALSVPSHNHRSSVQSPATHSQPLFRCSLTSFREISPTKSDAVSFTSSETIKRNDQKDGIPGNGGEEYEEEEGKGISRIRVSRQKYIPVSKAELLDGIISNMFDADDDDTERFLLLST